MPPTLINDGGIFKKIGAIYVYYKFYYLPLIKAS